MEAAERSSILNVQEEKETLLTLQSKRPEKNNKLKEPIVCVSKL